MVRSSVTMVVLESGFPIWVEPDPDMDCSTEPTRSDEPRPVDAEKGTSGDDGHEARAQ